MVFFALVYVVEGIGQTGGLIAQPLNYFLKQTYGWTPVQVTAYLTVLNLPWIIKPVYGIVSDFLPLFGYRRKSYLVLANLMAAGAYCWVTQITSPGEIIVALLLSAYGMAISSTVCGAILVENGQKFGASDSFVNQQWLWLNAAPDFADHPKVVNGCSDLFVEVFGERGRHARSAVGMSSLPGGIPVEIEVIVAVR